MNQKILKIEPPEPHGDKQRLIFSAFLYGHLREIWCCCGTKFGKTLGATVAQINLALSKPGTKHRWVAPIYSQTRQPKEYFERILPGPPHTKVNRADNTILICKIKTRLEFWHAQNPSSLEGDGIHSYIFDEAAKQPPEIRASARTTTTRTKGQMCFISYPFGKNWFYDGCMDAKDHMEWSFKNGIPPEKIFLHARTRDNPTIDPIVIENAKRELPSKLYRQFYEAEFLDDGSVFSDFNKCIFGEKLDIYGDMQAWYEKDHNDFHVVIGADWAKINDYTVFTAINMATHKVCGFLRFHKRNYTEQIRMLSYFCKKFKTVEMILHDKTGVGEAIDDQLPYINQPYRGITLTNALKTEFVLKLTTGFEQSQILIPNWPEMISELKAYEAIPNRIGTLSYGAPSGKHDDIVCSLFFCYYAYLLYADSKFEVTYLDELGNNLGELTDLERYYMDISDD